jgi:dihydroorotate dehydrogenase
MYKLIKPLLFSMSPEKAHHFSFNNYRNICKLPFAQDLTQILFDISTHQDAVELFGLKFKNRIGLAAGFDKDALIFDEFANFGFGHIEIGTITPKAQPGNEQPRLFRLVKDQAILNRMGFNNSGALAAVEKLKNRKRKDVIIGGNIGKNKITPNEEAIHDYTYCLKELYEVVDYFVVNVSSPNTPGLRALQDKGPLTDILNELQKLNQSLGSPKPLLLKIAPDLELEQLSDIADLAFTTQLSGIIATNTTIDRSGLLTGKKEVESLGAGGISGKPLTKRCTEVIHFLNKEMGGKIPIIGVGGIMNGRDAKEKIDAGASLIQLYTGFIYQGPGLVKECIRALRAQKK